MRTRPLIIFLLLLGLCRYALLARYMHPYADDLSYAATAFDEPFSDRLVHEYLSWNGRITSNILVLRGPLVLGLDPGLMIYRLIPVLLIVLMVSGWLLFLRALRPWGVPVAWTVPGALLFATLWLNTLPDLTEGLYWYTGAVTYTLPNALLLFLVAAGLHLERAQRGSPQIMLVLLLLALGLWIAWSNEVHMVVVLALVMLWLVVVKRSGGRVPSFIRLVLVLSLAAAMIMVLAPGNSTRAAHFPLRADVLNTLSMGSLQMLRFLIAWVLSPAVCILSFLWLGHLREVDALPLPKLRFRTSLGLLVAMLFVIMALPYWATGILGQHRTVNVAFFLFLPMWATALVALERDVLRPRNIGLLRQRGVVQVLTVLLVLSFLLGGNDGRVASDLLTGAAARSDSAWVARYGEVEKARVQGRSTVSFAPIPLPPVAMRIMEPDTAPDHWTNTSLARYLGAPGVRIIGPTAR